MSVLTEWCMVWDMLLPMLHLQVYKYTRRKQFVYYYELYSAKPDSIAYSGFYGYTYMYEGLTRFDIMVESTRYTLQTRQSI